MHILFLSQYYPPEIGAAANRIGYFAQFLERKGHEVAVLTSSPNYPEGKLYPGYENSYSVKNENGVTVYRTWIFLSRKSHVIARLSHYLSFILSSFVARRKIQRPDVIIATSPPLFVGLLGVIFKRIWKTKLITDIRDLWPESVESVGAIKNKKLLKQGQRLANWVYKNSDRLSATSPGIQKNLPKSVQEKISILPNGAELDLFRPDTDGTAIRKKWNLLNKFIVLYTGNLGLAQAPEIFLKTAELLKHDENIVFLIVGTGVFLPKLQYEAQKKTLTNIIFTGSQTRSQMPYFVASAQICIIPYKKADTFRHTFPSKMFDYMAGGKPIIINLAGEAGKLIQEAKCGFVIKEENPKSLAQAILSLKENPDKIQKMGIAGRKFVLENYTREEAAQNLEKLLEGITMRL